MSRSRPHVVSRCSLKTLCDHLGVQRDKDARIIWEQTHNTFGAELPKELFRDIFESRRETMIAAKQWASDKPRVTLKLVSENAASPTSATYVYHVDPQTAGIGPLAATLGLANEGGTWRVVTLEEKERNP